jgi:RimJ/RimL family protein N-acetyltransferase
MGILELAARLPDTLSTPRLVLRRPVLADVMALTELANNIKIHRMLARLPHPYTSEDAIHFIQSIARSGDHHAYAIDWDGTMVGVAGLQFGPGKNPELGYWIGEAYWGKGIATEIAIGLVAAVRATGAAGISARALSVNAGSRRVLEKAGLKLEHERIDDCGVHKGVGVCTFSTTFAPDTK